MSRQDRFELSIFDRPAEESVDSEQGLIVEFREKLRELTELEARLHRQRNCGQPTFDDLVLLACRLYDERQIRERIFARANLSEKLWMMLLVIFCFPSRGKFLTASGTSIASFCSETNGLAVADQLLEKGLIDRKRSTSDGRKINLSLTAEGRLFVIKVLSKIHEYHAVRPPYPGRAGQIA